MLVGRLALLSRCCHRLPVLDRVLHFLCQTTALLSMGCRGLPKLGHKLHCLRRGCHGLSRTLAHEDVKGDGEREDDVCCNQRGK